MKYDRSATQQIFAYVWMALTESAQLDQQQNFYNLGYTSTESAQGTCSSNGLAPVVFSTVKGQTQLFTRSTSFFFRKIPGT